MNELFLYDLFRSILSHSSVFEGRFAVAKGTSDINEGNYAETVTDALGGLIDGRKYPGVVLLPPQDSVPSYARGWATYRLHMFFCTLDGRTGTQEILSPNYQTLTSGHTIAEDWSDMRGAANDFRLVLDGLARQINVSLRVRPNISNPDTYDRFSWAQNDRINGVRLSFDVDVSIPCVSSDYPENLKDVLAIPEARHPQHKH